MPKKMCLETQMDCKSLKDPEKIGLCVLECSTETCQSLCNEDEECTTSCENYRSMDADTKNGMRHTFCGGGECARTCASIVDSDQETCQDVCEFAKMLCVPMPCKLTKAVHIMANVKKTAKAVAEKA